jgi:hypothetical protein
VLIPEGFLILLVVYWGYEMTNLNYGGSNAKHAIYVLLIAFTVAVLFGSLLFFF